MNQAHLGDTDYNEYVIAEVRRYDDGRYEIYYGMMYAYEATDGIAPTVGEIARFYNGRVPGEIRGLMVGGRLYFYKTMAEREAEHAAWLEARDAEARARFPEYDRRYAALPAPFQRRIDYFRRHPRFRLTTEGADLHVCELAVRLAQECGTPEAVAEFQKLPDELRCLERPWLVKNRESGQALDVVCELAFWWQQAPDRLLEVAGAMEHISGEPYNRESDSGVIVREL